MKKTFFNFIVSPWYATFYPGKMFGGAESQLGPLYLAFLPFVFFFVKPKKEILLVAVFSAIFYLFWFFGFPAVRFLLPLIPFLASLIAFFIAYLPQTPGLLKLFTKTALSIFLLINCGLCFYYSREELVFFIKRQTAQDYLNIQERTSRVFSYINTQTPPDSKVMLVNELRTFYLERESIREPLYAVYDAYYLKDRRGIIDDLKKKGINYIVYAKPLGNAGAQSVSLPGNRLDKLLDDNDFVSAYLEKKTNINYTYDPLQRLCYTVYRIK